MILRTIIAFSIDNFSATPNQMTNPTFHIAVLKGDGIGVDVTESTIAVLEAATQRVGGFGLKYDYLDAGAAYYLVFPSGCQSKSKIM